MNMATFWSFPTTEIKQIRAVFISFKIQTQSFQKTHVMVEITKDKHVYAALSNMAQKNFFMVMSSIVKVLGKEPDLNKDMADWVMKDLNNKKEDVKLKAFELLSKGFPFLDPMADIIIGKGMAKDRLEAYKFLLPKIKNVLNFYRNYLTHFDSDEDKEIYSLNLNERSLVPCLEHLFKAGLRTVQQRFSYEEREMSFVKNKNMGKVDSKYSLYKKELISNQDTEPTAVLSQRGLVFFICLLLEKRYIHEMLEKTKVFYTYGDLNSEKRKSILFEAISVYRVRLPKKRYESQKDKVAMAMDMVNELQRCPKEIFDLLSRQDQELFRSEESEDGDVNTMLMIRHSDRFASLALKYIDMMEVFKQIRFQINLGKYRFAFYRKRCINATEEGYNYTRSLEKELHGFGRLHEIEQQRRDKWADLVRDYDDIKEDTADTLPYITDHRASYMISNNRIGLYWKASIEDPYPGLPKLISDPKATDLREKKKNGEKVATLAQPKCFLSTHELVSLLFYHLIFREMDSNDAKKIGLESAELMILNWTKGFKKFIKAVIDGEITSVNAVDSAKRLGLAYPQQFPKKLVDHIEGRQRQNAMNEKLSKRLHEHIETAEKLLKHIENDIERVKDKRNRRGTKTFVEIKNGRLASWLASDIIALQPTPVNGGKLTGLNFRIMQSALAVYDDLDRIKRIFVGARLIMNDYQHPFLMKVIDKAPKTVVNFYKSYLAHKIEWLKSLDGCNLKEYTFLTRGTDKWSERDEQYYNRLLLRYLEQPLELPRGLFAESIKTALKHRLGNDFIKGDKREDANTAFLICKYFKKRYRDENQEFYTQPDGRYRRFYSFFKALAPKGATDYGKTVTEIDSFLRNDMSLSILSNCDKTMPATDNSSLDKAREEVQLKLAKALAKNPSVDKAQRIRDIINSSHKLRLLSPSLQNRLIVMMTGDAVEESGFVKKHLDKFKGDDRKTEITNLSHALHKLKENEKLIRRYKVEDIILFLMARSILFENNSEMFTHRFDMFRLKDIRPIRRQEGVGALEICVPFSITLRIKGSNMPVRISQEDIKLKNYGDFMRFVYDSRLETLIPYLIDDPNAIRIDIMRSDLEEEFTNYDRKRYEVFANVHKIEQLILQRHRELKEKSSPYYHYIDNGKQLAVCGSFSKMLEYDGGLSSDEEAETVNIRNSFAHNTYRGRNSNKVDVDTNILGDIAPALSDKMGQKLSKMKNKDENE